MKPASRRRPGQRAVASKALAPNVYDLTKDRQIRARARFENLSLGQALMLYQYRPYVNLTNTISYWANEQLEILDNNKSTESELMIVSKIENYEIDTDSDLLAINPDLYRVIKSYVLLGLNSELAKAKRARHIGNVIKHVEEMSCEPRYNTLDTALLDDVPY